MIVEDQRNIVCGGDPFNYLKSTLKGLSFQVDPGEDVKLIVLKDKFPYDRSVYEGLARTSRFKVTDFSENDGEVSIVMRRE